MSSEIWKNIFFFAIFSLKASFETSENHYFPFFILLCSPQPSCRVDNAVALQCDFAAKQQRICDICVMCVCVCVDYDS